MHKFAPIPGIQGDMGWKLCKQRRYENIIKFWNRSININVSRLTHKIFMWDKQCNGDNWSHDVELIFEYCNLDDVYTNLLCVDLNVVKQRLDNLFNDEWKEDMLSKPKLRTYAVFKNRLCTEKYVSSFISRKYRSLLAQIRLGILPLRIETGRAQGILVDNRLCEFCSTDEIEDEKHFLFICPLNAIPRQLMLNSIISDCPDFMLKSYSDKLRYMFERKCVITARYIQDAMDNRTRFLYR